MNPRPSPPSIVQFGKAQGLLGRIGTFLESSKERFETADRDGRGKADRAAFFQKTQGRHPKKKRVTVWVNRGTIRQNNGTVLESNVTVWESNVTVWESYGTAREKQLDSSGKPAEAWWCVWGETRGEGRAWECRGGVGDGGGVR